MITGVIVHPPPQIIYPLAECPQGAGILVTNRIYLQKVHLVMLGLILVVLCPGYLSTWGGKK